MSQSKSAGAPPIGEASHPARLAFVLGTALLLLGSGAAAHQVSPADVLSQIDNASARAAFDVTAVERQADDPRRLVIRVGPGWASVYPERRRNAAEVWCHLWRDAVPNGTVAIVDRNDLPMVSFDADGYATLEDPEPPPSTPHDR
jgi:hypothetical protein